MRWALFVALGLAAAGPAMADQVFSCSDTNTGLHFVLYEDASGTRGGHAYLNGIQIAVLNTWRVNEFTVRGAVSGNTADAQLVFNASRREIYVQIGDTLRQVCGANVS